MTHNLDLRGVACPLNFVKTKIYLDKLGAGEILGVILDAGEPVESVYSSIQAEGHKVNAPEINKDGSYSLSIQKMALLFFLQCLVFQALAFTPKVLAVNTSASNNAGVTAIADTAVTNTPAASNSEPGKFNVEEQIKIAKEAVMLAPTDVEKRLHLARLLRRSGNYKPAAIEYLNITVLNPSFSAAYHEMTLSKPSVGQLDEAIVRLKDLKVSPAKQLACKMSLSELYEGKEDYYQAARVLVDLQYSQNVPPKYVDQIDSRVHMLLGKTKDTRTTEKAIEQKTNVEEEEFTPSSPLPMPDVSPNTTDNSVNKLRNKRAKEGYGHAQLSP